MYKQSKAILESDAERRNAEEGTKIEVPKSQEYEVPKATPEEQSLFEECNRVAHWQRGIPGSIVAALLVVGGIKRGLLLTHPNAHHLYQGIPTVMGASAAGYVLAKATYNSTREDRFLAELPDSNVARQIRIKRKLEPPGSTLANPSVKPPSQDQHLDSSKSEPIVSSGPPSSLKNSSMKGKYGDEGYEELEK